MRLLRGTATRSTPSPRTDTAGPRPYGFQFPIYYEKWRRSGAIRRAWLLFNFRLCFHLMLLLIALVNTETIPMVRMRRMRRMFAKSGGILVEDYEHFTQRDAPTGRSKVPRKLAQSHSRPDPGRN